MKAYVEIASGQRIELADLPRCVPSTAFMGNVHIEVCERLAQGIELPEAYHGTYVNLLFRKSSVAREITALIELQRSGRLSIRTVQAGSWLRRCRDLLDDDIHVRLSPAPEGQLIDYHEVRGFVKKVAIHRLFRFVRRRRLRASTVVRGWVDMTDAIYPDAVESATLLIYPYKPLPWRQFQYVKHCWSKGRTFSMMGMPYRFRDAIRMLLYPSHRDRTMVHAEAYAAKMHADELLALGVRTLFTTDDFELAGYLMHTHLIDCGVSSCNSAHGVGLYGPYVRYHEFACYNSRQRQFYQIKGQVDAFQFIANLPDDLEAQPDPGDGYRPHVVYLQGNWRRSGKLYEADLEDRILEHLRDVCRQSDLPLVIKMHPNTTPSTEEQLKQKFGIATVRTLDNRKTAHPIFLTLLSTAYYTYMPQGPVAVVVDDLIRPESLYGEGVPCAHVDQLSKFLTPFQESIHWTASHRRQIEEEKHRCQA